jgi:hypothetical protein
MRFIDIFGIIILAVVLMIVYYSIPTKHFGCLPNHLKQIHLEFEFHISYLGYRICEQTTNSNGLMAIKDIRDYCKVICLPKCEAINFVTKVEKKSNNSSQTIVEMHPLKSRHTEYVETDFNQLIYKCGGIIGLWFGLSSMSIAQLFTIISSVRLSIWKFTQSFQKFKLRVIKLWGVIKKWVTETILKITNRIIGFMFMFYLFFCYSNNDDLN